MTGCPWAQDKFMITDLQESDSVLSDTWNDLHAPDYHLDDYLAQ